jgi:hypothetical protein
LEAVEDAERVAGGDVFGMDDVRARQLRSGGEDSAENREQREQVARGEEFEANGAEGGNVGEDLCFRG